MGWEGVAGGDLLSQKIPSDSAARSGNWLLTSRDILPHFSTFRNRSGTIDRMLPPRFACYGHERMRR